MTKLGKFTSALMLAGYLSLGAGIHAAAQQVIHVDPATKETPETSKPAILPPVYDSQMMRLSEILGALHYLRELCGANEGQQWREEMQNLIAEEEPTAERRAMLIARFNRGFRGYSEVYRECTDAAIEANNRYIRQGTRLAGEIPSRFGR